MCIKYSENYKYINNLMFILPQNSNTYKILDFTKLLPNVITTLLTDTILRYDL